MADVIEAKLRKVGNSLGIIIPNDILQQLGYAKGDIIHLAISPADIKIRNRDLLALAGIDKGKKPFRREKRDRF